MITKVLVGNLFESEAQTLTNTVNTVGIMGKGIALEFKRRFPDMYRDYVRRCERHEVQLGEPYVFATIMPPWVLNFPTKAHWRNVARLSDIEAGLEHLARHYQEWGITSLAVPPLGCGEGQLEWRAVGKTLYRHLDRLAISVEMYAPFGTPPEQLTREFLAGATDQVASAEPGGQYRVSPGAYALVEVLDRISSQRYHWPVGATIFQKLAYFATEAGLPTGLQFQRAPYGPFSPDLKRMRSRLVNNGLIEERPRGELQEIRPGRTFQDASSAYAPYIRRWDRELDRLADLFLRLDRSDAETAATVHFAAKTLRRERGVKPTEMDVLQAVHDWKPRLKPEAIAATIRDLNALGWLDVRSSDELPLPPDPSRGADPLVNELTSVQ